MASASEPSLADVDRGDERAMPTHPMRLLWSQWSRYCRATWSSVAAMSTPCGAAARLFGRLAW